MQTPPKPKTKAKKPRSRQTEQLSVDELVELYKRKNSGLNAWDEIVLRVKLARRSNKARDKSRAKAKLRGESRGGKLSEIDFDTDVARVDTALAESYRMLDAQADNTAKAKASTQEYLKAAEAYQKALDPLILAFNNCKEIGIDGVDAKAGEITDILMGARAMIPEYKVAVALVVRDLGQLEETIKSIREQDWVQTVQEAKGLPLLLDEQLKAVQNAEVALAEKVQEIDAYAQTQEGKLHKLVVEICSRIIAWRQGKDARDKIDMFESLLNGGISAINTINHEPMSHTAVQGVHMLIHGCVDGIKLIYTEVKKKGLVKKDLGALDDLLADDYIQWKLDMVAMGLRWVTEPLGFIPTVGEIVRTACDAAVEFGLDVLRESAKQQAAKFQDQKAQAQALKNETVPAVEKAIMDTIASSITSSAGEMSKEALKQAGETLSEVATKGEVDIPKLVIGMCFKVLGAPIKKLLVEVVPSMKMLDKDQIKADLEGARQAAVDMAGKAKGIGDLKGQMNFTFDEDGAKAATLEAILALEEDDTADFLLAISDQLEASAGVAFLAGDKHSPANVDFVKKLIRAGHGDAGEVHAGAKSRVFAQKMHVDIDAKWQDALKDFWKVSGIPSNRELVFTPRR